jgi:succinate dehydrogenase hydrophobic anchor subunit
LRRKRKYTPSRLPIVVIALLLLLLESDNIVVRSTTNNANIAFLSVILAMLCAIAVQHCAIGASALLREAPLQNRGRRLPLQVHDNARPVRRRCRFNLE